MPQRAILFLAIVFVAFFNISAYSQNDSFFGSGDKKPAAPSASGKITASPPPPNQVMSSEQFAKTLNTMNTNTKAQLKQQVSDELSKSPTANPYQNDNTSSSSSSYSTPSNNTPAPSSQEANTNTSTSLPTMATPTQSSQTTPQSINKQNTGGTYTGFGTGNTNSGSTNSSGTSTGWGIKY